MRCQNCSLEIPDNSTVCPNCAAPVAGTDYAQPQYNNTGSYQQPNQQQYQQPYQQPYQQQYQQAYQPPYQQPYTSNLTALKSGWLIAAIVVSAFTGNTVSLVLAIIALVYSNKYNDGIRNASYQSAEYDRNLVHRLGVASWVITLIGVLFVVSSIVLFILFSFGLVSSGLGYELYEEFDSFLMCASNLLM